MLLDHTIIVTSFNKLPECYRILRFIAVLTKAYHWYLSEDNRSGPHAYVPHLEAIFQYYHPRYVSGFSSSSLLTKSLHAFRSSHVNADHFLLDSDIPTKMEEDRNYEALHWNVFIILLLFNPS
jgi:hypothetical protein